MNCMKIKQLYFYGSQSQGTLQAASLERSHDDCFCFIQSGNNAQFTVGYQNQRSPWAEFDVSELDLVLWFLWFPEVFLLEWSPLSPFHTRQNNNNNLLKLENGRCVRTTGAKQKPSAFRLGLVLMGLAPTCMQCERQTRVRARTHTHTLVSVIDDV